MIRKTISELPKSTKSFSYAIEGIIWSIQTQNNYRIAVFLSVLSIIGGFYWNISSYEWLVLVLTMSLGLVIETINTAFEATLDAVDKTHRIDIKIAKDCSAAAMLIFSVASLIVAGIIFLPHIL